MKRLLYVFTALAMLLTVSSCKAPVAQQGGKEDIAYLLFVSPSEYYNKVVQVSIDDATSFDAEVVKAKKASRKGKQYGIATGTRSIKVTSEGKVLYQKKIFVSSQEVKQIILP
jgi:hypothetical protein